MPKAAKSKSSASSGTRKKNAQKALKKEGDPSTSSTSSAPPTKASQPSQRGEKKSKKERKAALAAQKKKSFIPPPKPPQPPPDPLDSMGLATLLPPDMVVLLRKLGKKDVVTRERALEGLKSWIESEGEQMEDWQKEQRENDLVVMLPCWLHLFPRLCISPTRKLRLLTSQILSSLLSLPSVREELLFSPQHQESFLGPWSILTYDNDKLVSKVCKKAWDSSWKSNDSSKGEVVSKLRLDSETSSIILSHLSNVLLSDSPSNFLSASFASVAPVSIHSNHLVNGSGIGSGDVTPNSRDAKNRDDNLEEGRQDTDGRLKAGALGCLSWMISTFEIDLPENLIDLLKNSKIYESLLSVETASLPSTRIRTYGLMNTLNSSKQTSEMFKGEILSKVAPEALISLWEEKDLSVIRSGIDAWLPILRANPIVWESQIMARRKTGNQDQDDEEEDEDSEDEDDSEDESGDEDQEAVEIKKQENPQTNTPTFPAYSSFLSFLARGLSPAPQLAYPTILLFLTTLPSTIIGFDFQSANDLLEKLYSPLGSRDLDSDNRGDINAFSTSILESAGWLSRRILKGGTEAGVNQGDGKRLVEVWFSSIWKNFVLGPSEEIEQSSKQEEGEEEKDGISDEDRLNRKNRAYNSIVPSRLSVEFGAAFQRIVNSTENQEVCQGVLEFMKDSLFKTLKQESKSGKEIEKVVTRSVAIFENLIKEDASNQAPELAQKIHSLIQSLINDSIQALSDSSPAIQQHLLKFISSVINSNLLSSSLSTSTESRTSLTLLSEDILPKIISSGNGDGQNSAQLIGGIMKILNRSSPILDSSEFASAAQDKGNETWIKALEASIALPNETQRIQAILQVLEAEESSRKGGRDSQVTDSEAEREENSRPLDESSISLASQLCSSNETSVGLEKLVSKILPSDGRDVFFISQDKVDEMLLILSSKIEGVHSTMISAFTSQVGSTSTSTIKSKSQIRNQNSEDYASLVPVLRVWNLWLMKDPKQRLEGLLSTQPFKDIPKAIFELAWLKPEASQMDPSLKEVQREASNSWNALSQVDEKKTELREIARNALSLRLSETEVPLGVVLKAGMSLKEAEGASSLIQLLPGQGELEKLAVEVASIQPDSTLALLDPLAPASSTSASSSRKVSFDAQGHSTYSRFNLLLLLSIQNDRTFSKSIASWMIPHLLLFGLLIEDKLSNQGDNSKNVFGQECNLSDLQHKFRESVQGLTSLIASLSSDLEEKWHTETVAALQREKGDGASGSMTSSISEPLRVALLTIWRLARSNSPSSVQFSRVFSRLLSGILSFSSASAGDGERWLKLGQSIMTTSPLLSSAVFYSSKSLASSTPFYDRLRNDLASRLAGVSAARANDEGLKLLNLLLAVAPNADTGDVALIPQQRSIFLLQTIQKWFASDEDLDEELNAGLATLFVHLLPIVQGVQGSHLDLIFDLLENNLELSGIKEKETWPTIFESLNLLDQIRDLCNSNKGLKAAWREREDPIWEKIHDLFLELAPTSSEATASSNDNLVQRSTCLPRDAVAGLLVDLVREVPSSAFSSTKDQEILIRLMAGISGSNSEDGSVQEISREMQVVAYKLLNAGVSDKVRELVVEAAVGRSNDQDGEEGAESTTQPQLDLTLPASLLEMVSASVNSSTAHMLLEDQLGDDDDEEMMADLENAREGRKAVFGLLLCWMAILDHFEEASLQIRSAYISQIEKLELIEGLASSVFNLLGGKGGKGGNIFEAGKWGIEEVALDELDLSSGLSLQALASHVYLRSLSHLPTLIRSWWFSLKDRQLSMTVVNFTTKHCSPSITSRELAHLRQEDSLSKLEDEAMTIKFQGTEVIATYVVDEHPIEMGVKIPNDFPLHAIEIRDPADAGKRVGISESQWRAWILATQQLITSKNGLILDALMLFKKNAEAKFAGFEGAECAICYSIISPMDRSLPVKPCPTCKNRFHSSCLFKWVTTSGSSTCPLCRSVI